MYYESIMQRELANLIQFSSEDTIGASFKGAIYRKQLAKYGDWVNPQYPRLSNNPIMSLDENWGAKIVENFNNNILGHSVAVPSTHTNDPEKNRGRVISLESIPGDGLYGELEILEADTVQALDKGTIFDVSISFSHDYVRKDDNKHYGPTLEHVALVNDPYLSEMKTFEKLEMALSKSVEPNTVKLGGNNVIMLSIDKLKELHKMATKTITNDKAFDVIVKFNDGTEHKEVTIKPGETLEVPEDVAEDVTNQVTGAIEIAGDEGKGEGDDAPVTPAPEVETPEQELSRLREENATLKLSKEFDALLDKGLVIPAQKDAVMALAKLPTTGVQLSKDSEPTDVASLVLGILSAGSQQFSKDESGSGKIDEDAQKKKDLIKEGQKPSENLSEGSLAGMKAVGTTPEKFDELAKKYPDLLESKK